MVTVNNPVIPGFYPDPTVCRVGDTYYLACSSFEYLPGIPIFASQDLVNWRQVGNVATTPSHLDFPDNLLPSQGVFAPTLRFHNGLFYLIVSVAGIGEMDRAPAIFTAASASGPWSKPVWVPGIRGIDPDIAWDDADNCYCTVATKGVIRQARINAATGETLEEPRVMWSGTPGMHAPEAPHLYHIGQWWYLLIAEGGTSRGHSISVARAASPTGPFTPLPQNPILTHRGLGLPIQNVGHGDLTQGPDGSWWLVLLGVRQIGQAKAWHPLGRETYLNPVTWLDGWPRTPLVAEQVQVPWPLDPVSVNPAFTRDDFTEPNLGAHWITPGRYPAEICDLTSRTGYLTLRAGAGRQLLTDDADLRLVAQRQPGPASIVRTEVDASQGQGGLTVWLDGDHHYDFLVGGGQADGSH